jgi:uncharacterized membrane protein YidH (DUF202 family)
MALGTGHQIRRRELQDGASLEWSGRYCADELRRGHAEIFFCTNLPLVSFAVGAMLPAVAFLAAYLGHLRYGSAMIAEDDRDFRILEGGELWNLLAIGLMLLSVLTFAVGIWLAAVALPKLELATG